MCCYGDVWYLFIYEQIIVSRIYFESSHNNIIVIYRQSLTIQCNVLHFDTWQCVVHTEHWCAVHIFMVWQNSVRYTLNWCAVHIYMANSSVWYTLNNDVRNILPEYISVRYTLSNDVWYTSTWYIIVCGTHLTTRCGAHLKKVCAVHILIKWYDVRYT